MANLNDWVGMMIIVSGLARSSYGERGRLSRPALLTPFGRDVAASFADPSYM